MLGLGDQRHDVVQERPLALDGLADLRQVLVVDAGDHHRVHLHEDVAFDQHFQALLLAFDEDRRPCPAADALVLPVDPGVDLRPDVGIDAVDRDGDVLDVGLGQLVDAVGQGEAVGRDAQLDVGGLLGQHAEGGEGPLRVGQRVAGAGNAQHGHLRDRGGDGHRLFHRLLGRQQFGDDAGPRFVGAVVFAIAVMTLNVAGRGDGHVHAGEVVVGLLRIAGMIENPLPDRFGQVAQLIGRAPARAGRTAPLGRLSFFFLP